jgi:RNA polymerase sigma factor (sigma-70 family)
LAEGGQAAGRSATPEAFARFLAWLNRDPAEAAQEYERLRRRIARFFAYRGCPDADALADDVIDRAVGKVGTLAEGDAGQCAGYLYGVARNVYLESLRRRSAQARFEAAAQAAPRAEVAAAEERARREREQECLDRCLAGLTASERELVATYYQMDPAGRPARRREMAERHGLTAESLRQRTHRLRERLRACLARCLGGE